MSSKNSTRASTESEYDWEESVIYIKKDLADSDSETDPHIHLTRLSEKNKEKQKFGGIVQISDNKRSSFKNCCKDCTQLKAQQLENTKQFPVVLSPESTLCLTLKDYYSLGHPQKIYLSEIPVFPSKCHQSCKEHLCLNGRSPHTSSFRKLKREQNLHATKKAYTVDKLHKNHLSTDYPPTLKKNKAVQVSFPCREKEAGDNILPELFSQPAVPAEISNTAVGRPTGFHRAESICSKTRNSNQPITDNLDYSPEINDKSDSAQGAHRTSSNPDSQRVVIRLRVEAVYANLADSLEENCSSSNGGVGKEDSGRHTLAFNLKDPEHKQKLKKLCIFIVPSSEFLDTEKQNQIFPFTKEAGFSQTPAGEARQTIIESSESSQVQATWTQSSESSGFSIHVDQNLSKQVKTNQSPRFVKSLPHCKVIPICRTSKVQKGQPKASKHVNSFGFTKVKRVQKSPKFQVEHPVPHRFLWCQELDNESIKQNIQKAKEIEINDLYYVPLSKTPKCYCSPLLDLTAGLYCERKYCKKFQNFPRKCEEQTAGSKLTQRFPSSCLLNRRRVNSKRHQYISSVRKINSFKMQRILNYCLGRTEGQQVGQNHEEKVCSAPDISSTGRNRIVAEHSPTDGSSSVHLIQDSCDSPISPPSVFFLSKDGRYSPIHCLHSETGRPASQHFLPNEKILSSTPCIETERHTWNTATSHDKCNVTRSPCCAKIAQVVEPPKERDMFKKTDFGATQGTGGNLVLKKFSHCPCGIMPQSSLVSGEDISESISTHPNFNQTSNKTQLNQLHPTAETLSTEDACYCSSCYASPPNSLHNVNEEASRNHFFKVQSYFEHGFPKKNFNENMAHRNKAERTSERKNVRFQMRPDILKKTGPSGIYTALSSNDDGQISKHGVHHTECSCCSCCHSTIHEPLGKSKEAHNSFSSRHDMVKKSLYRDSIFLIDPGEMTRSQCKCSEEIPLFHINQAEMPKGKRAAISKRKESDYVQGSSQINCGWKRREDKCKCCSDEVQYKRLQ